MGQSPHLCPRSAGWEERGPREPSQLSAVTIAGTSWLGSGTAHKTPPFGAKEPLSSLGSPGVGRSSGQ